MSPVSLALTTQLQSVTSALLSGALDRVRFARARGVRTHPLDLGISFGDSDAWAHML